MLYKHTIVDSTNNYNLIIINKTSTPITIPDDIDVFMTLLQNAVNVCVTNGTNVYYGSFKQTQETQITFYYYTDAAHNVIFDIDDTYIDTATII